MLDSWLWQLEPSHFRVAFAVVQLVNDEPTTVRNAFWGAVDVPAGALVTTLDRLAERANVTRSVVRTALARLAAGGLVTVAAHPRGYTMIALVDPETFGIEIAQQSHSSTMQHTTQIDGSARARSHSDRTADRTAIAQQIAQQAHSETHSDIPRSVAGVTDAIAAAEVAVEATRTADAVAFSIETDDMRVEVVDGSHSGSHSDRDGGYETAGMARALTRASEISEISEIPDPDLEPLEERGSGGEGTDEPDDAEPTAAQLARVDRIPPRAWLAADYLRACILDAQPTNVLARKRWELPGHDTASARTRLVRGGASGAERAADLATLAEAGRRDGLRLKWADEFRLLHERDGRPWDEIALTVSWLFKSQPADQPRFVVLSPTALREKWDRIQLARQRTGRPGARDQGGGPVQRERVKW